MAQLFHDSPGMPSPDLARAVAAILDQDSGRILALASSLRRSDRRIESTVAGGSMAGTLAPGVRIQIELGMRKDYGEGEVVALVIDGRIVVHRILSVGRYGRARGYLLTRGDATLTPDPPQPVEHIIGPVTGVWRGDRWQPVGGRCRRSLQARMSMIAIESIIGAVLCFSPGAAARLAELFRRSIYSLKAITGGQAGSGKPASPSAV